MSKVVSVCLLSVSIILGLSAEGSTAEQTQLSKADDLLNKGKPKAAATILRQLLKADQKNAEAHMELGAALAAQVEDNKYEEAMAEEETALKLDPKSYGARRILGHIYSNLKKHDEAIKLLKEAQELKPDSYSVSKDLAIAYVAAGKNDDAIVALRKAIVLKPNSLEAHLRLSSLLQKKEQVPEAIKVAQKAVEINPKKADPHLQLANLFLASKNYDAAIESYKEAIAANGYDELGCLNPLTAANAFSGLGWAQAKKDSKDQKNLELAIKNEKKAIKFYPTYGNSYMRLAKIYAMAGQAKHADEAFKISMRGSNEDKDIATDYAAFLVDQKRNEEARAILKKVLDKNPDFAPAKEVLSRIETEKRS